MEFKGSRTEKNLLAAFAGESQARTRYTFFSSVAKKEGYEQISGIFQETADNEREHAQLFFNHLKGGMAEITASYPAGVTGTTAANLHIELCFLPAYSPNLNLIERLWKFVKKQCLYSKYYADFVTFKDAIATCLSETDTKHKSVLDSLLTLNFQTFKKAQFVPV